jgi:GNAT superfamily N-acetyltransferase
MAVISPVRVSLEEWNREWLTDAEATFLALADDAVIGLAGLHIDPDDPTRAENALTAVRREWRGRGVATTLKRRTLAHAAAHGLTEVYTWTRRTTPTCAGSTSGWATSSGNKATRCGRPHPSRCSGLLVVMSAVTAVILAERRLALTPRRGVGWTAAVGRPRDGRLRHGPSPWPLTPAE